MGGTYNQAHGTDAQGGDMVIAVEVTKVQLNGNGSLTDPRSGFRYMGPEDDIDLEVLGVSDLEVKPKSDQDDDFF